jgi:hypothetical protein
MFRIVTAATEELESPELALEEIKADLKRNGPLLAHSIGFVGVPVNFVDQGLFAYMAQNLDFPLVGLTTTLSSVEGKINPEQLSIMLFTGDEPFFSFGLSSPLSGVVEGKAGRESLEMVFKGLSDKAKKDLGGRPDLILAIFPILEGYGDRKLLDAMDKAVGGCSLFGGFALDYDSTVGGARPQILSEGQAYSDRVGAIFFRGIPTPRFIMTDILGDSLARQKAIVTKSMGKVLYEINDKPIGQYLESLGMVQKNILSAINANPLVLHFGREGRLGPGERFFPLIVRSIQPDGGFLCNSRVPEGTTVSFGLMDSQAILSSAECLFREVRDMDEARGILFFSCQARQLNMGWEDLAEMKLLDKVFDEKTIPHMLVYSGGEICPVVGEENGSLKNGYYNLSLVACVF